MGHAGAKDLRLLAAHHVRRAASGFATQTGQQMNRLAVPIHGQRTRCKRRCVSGALRIWHLAPAMLAADHAARHDGQAGLAPVADQGIEHRHKARRAAHQGRRALR